MSRTITAAELANGIYALRGTLADNASGPGQTRGILAIGRTRGARDTWTVLNVDGRTSQRSTDELIAAGIANADAPKARPTQSVTSYVPLRDRT